ncbi:bifunctional 2-polyprenyl-6-hydroxyphenol methylase/3-demethylubiquinol 3-O-methyltransferase UbiG [Neorickettsia risticii]|uniref:Ubiquinone biosynthesis O-methyltransferase n=1 Tax=Neorickettsia risticii (strain Illinois) TaxID=434131 RepID=C6V5A9_NEORI|nr:bifunctional 2-polyprenyl-6-hydroxyphenol methylase/3-demethylubiquinol 3-O-methyltransferase UbiG [Neorickettsia risticii]ACT69530.1 3-demethylubiquinone-9 3-methyltransferase [Neorickettsia risticii str. Illinois]
MTTVNKKEMEKFAALADEWHIANGSFAMLHKMNKVRVRYILGYGDIVGKKILDIGCGGGLLSEDLASLGGIVTAIDPCSKSINVAANHGRGEVKYFATSLEDYVKQNNNSKFDLICIMEVVEHIDNLKEFIHFCAEILLPGGKIFFSTLNKTVKSFLLGILTAEYILGIVPKHTHSWKKFLRPSVLNKFFACSGLEIRGIRGLAYCVLSDSWSLGSDVSMNYVGLAMHKK